MQGKFLILKMNNIFVTQFELFVVHSSSVSSKVVQVLNLSQAFAFCALCFIRFCVRISEFSNVCMKQRVINCFYLLNKPSPTKVNLKKTIIINFRAQKNCFDFNQNSVEILLF